MAVRIKIRRSESMPLTLRTYSFSVILAGPIEVTEQIANDLYEAGCDDAGVGSVDGVLTVDFEREAESLGDAIGTAVKDVERAGFVVARVEIDGIRR
jgi:hypothetical protein